MAYRDRSAIDIELFHGNAETVAAVNNLNCESFVEFPKVDVVDLEVLTPEQFGNGKHRANAHFVGLAAGDLEAAKDELVRNVEFIGTLARHKKCGGGSVRELRRVPCRHRALSAVGIEMRFQREQSFQRGVGTIALVAVATDFLDADFFAGPLIENRLRHSYRSDFAGEETFLLGTGGALLADQGVFVLGLAADLVAFGDDLGGLPHGHVDARIFLLENRTRVVVANDQADALDAAADGCVCAFTYDLVGGHGNRLQAGRTKPVDSDGGGRNRQAC